MSTETPADAPLQEFFKLRPDEFRSQVTVVKPDELGQKHLLHISKDETIELFTPNMTKRTADGEDRRVARICTAPTLVGSMSGYDSIIYEFCGKLNGSYYSGDGVVKWSGNWTIYGLPFEHALRPTAKLVPTVERSDEHWLITYNEDTVHYKPEVMGHFFVSALVQYRDRGTMHNLVEVYVQVDHEDGLFLDQQHHLTRGYWRARVRDFNTRDGVAGRLTMELEQLNKEAFDTHRKLTLSGPSLESLIPPSLSW